MYCEEDYEPKRFYSECPECGSDDLEYDHEQISDTVFKIIVRCNNCDFEEEFPEEEYNYEEEEEAEEDTEMSFYPTDDD